VSDLDILAAKVREYSATYELEFQRVLRMKAQLKEAETKAAEAGKAYNIVRGELLKAAGAEATIFV
jgi:nucleoid-associated protein YgaU